MFPIGSHSLVLKRERARFPAPFLDTAPKPA